MSYLQELGIRPGQDVQHRQKADPRDFPAASHLDKAASFLEVASPLVLREVVPHLDDIPARWNPGGFMVFPLGLHDELGSLRLHVWAAGVPRQTDQGPNIHEHGWHLSSKIIAGPYTDNLYKLDQAALLDSETLVNEDGLLGLYMTRRNAEGQDSLITDGTLVRPKLIAERSVPEAEVHHIEAGVYHLTTIPLEQLVATLVVDSPAFVESTGVLLASTKPQIARNRRMVDRSSAMLAREQIMVHHGLR